MLVKKLSEAFLEFIEPSLEFFEDPEPRTDAHCAACAVGHIVWNAVIMQKLNPEKDHLGEAKAQMGNIPQLNELVDVMVSRKRTQFGEDDRIIGVYDVTEKPDGSYSLWAQIVEPAAVM